MLTHDVGVHDAVPEAGQAPAEQHLPQRGAERGQHDACQEGERGHLRRCGDTRISCSEYILVSWSPLKQRGGPAGQTGPRPGSSPGCW